MSDDLVTNAQRIAARVAQLEGALIGRMVVEAARDASDAEIVRTLQHCVCSNMLIEVARKMSMEGRLLPALQATSDA